VRFVAFARCIQPFLHQMLEEESQWADAIAQYQRSADFYIAENATTTAIK